LLAVYDELIKIVRVSKSSAITTVDQYGLTSDFAVHVLSGVRFSSALSPTKDDKPIVLPNIVWSASRHELYPSDFQASCQAMVQAAPVLPNSLWRLVVSNMDSHWFDKEVFCHTEPAVAKSKRPQKWRLRLHGVFGRVVIQDDDNDDSTETATFMESSEEFQDVEFAESMMEEVSSNDDDL